MQIIHLNVQKVSLDVQKVLGNVHIFIFACEFFITEVRTFSFSESEGGLTYTLRRRC